mgnify:CR=1 FL=1
MPGKKSLIVSGMPNKEVSPPAIIDPTTPAGKALVHKKANIQSAHEISGGVRKIVEKSDGAFIEDGLDQEKDVKDVSDTIVSGQVEQSPSREESVKTVSKKVIDGEVEPNPDREEGTHTLNGNHIMGDGDRVEDNPSKETATKNVSDEIISGEVEDNPSREESVQSVTNEVISGDVEPSPDKQKGTHTVKDKIVEGRVEDNPTREEALNQVTDHLIDGGVDPNANDKGSLVSPTLPVCVSSGQLGPNASYNNDFIEARAEASVDLGPHASGSVSASDFPSWAQGAYVIVDIHWGNDITMAETTNLDYIDEADVPDRYTKHEGDIEDLRRSTSDGWSASGTDDEGYGAYIKVYAIKGGRVTHEGWG